MKIKLINYVLWASFILAMSASISHLSWTFGTVERPGTEWLGWIPAVAVDAGLAALAYTIQLRRKAEQNSLLLWIGVIGFALVSALANLYHALGVEAVAIDPSVIVWTKAIVLSATLPIMYIFLGEMISEDDAAKSEKAKQEAEAETTREREAEAEIKRQAEKAQARLDRAAEKELTEARSASLKAEAELIRVQLEQSQAKVEPAAPAASEPERIVCGSCGRSLDKTGWNTELWAYVAVTYLR